MKYIKKLYEELVPLENHKIIISEIKELDFILEDENCTVRYYNPGWSLNGFWIKVTTKERGNNYRDGYTYGDLNRDFKNLYLPYIDEWSNRIEELCHLSQYSFDFTFDLRAERSGGEYYWIYYFKIWKG